jgi:hypothetical protein
MKFYHFRLVAYQFLVCKNGSRGFLRVNVRTIEDFRRFFHSDIAFCSVFDEVAFNH